MASINANFQGRLGKDPEILQNGMLSFSVAVDNYDKERSTTWINCLVSDSNKYAFDKAHTYLKKGYGVFVHGGLKMNTYVGKNGETLSNLSCFVSDVDFILSSQKKENSDTEFENPTVGSYQNITTNNNAGTTATETQSENLPF